MAGQVPTPRAEDLVSVGTRISWGAILGGSLVALAIYMMLTVLGAAVGLAISDRVRPTTLHTAASVWVIITLSAAVFVGAIMTSLFTVGENKVEAIFCGVIMWALLLVLLMMLGAAGFGSGLVGMSRLMTVDVQVADPQIHQEIVDTAKVAAWYVFAGTWISMVAAATGAWLAQGRLSDWCRCPHASWAGKTFLGRVGHTMHFPELKSKVPTGH